MDRARCWLLLCLLPPALSYSPYSGNRGFQNSYYNRGNPSLPAPVPRSSYGGYAKPICSKQCENGGLCVASDVCKCSEPYFGAQCQLKKQLCEGRPATPLNSNKICSPTLCNLTCNEGHEFPDGTKSLRTTCKDGKWILESKLWKTIPDCAATCTPKCLNKGECISLNTCLCPNNFRGPYCQYSTDVCNPRKLGFNGNYECNGDSVSFGCTLRCPEGMKPEFAPAKEYTCRYDEGNFQPSKVPSCIYENGKLNDVEIFEVSNTRGRHMTDKPTGGTCYMWSHEHYKLFGGNVISFKSDCDYILLKDVDNSFRIQTPVTAPECYKKVCSQISFYNNAKHYTLTNDDLGFPILKEGIKSVYIPTKLPGMRLDLGSSYVTTSLKDGAVILKWNYLEDTIEIKVNEKLWNKTSGLCGSAGRNMLEETNIKEFASLARVDSINDVCIESIDDSLPCGDSAAEQKAHQFCSKLLHDKRFGSCRRVIDAKPYYDACLWEYCSCKDIKSCGCQSMAFYVKESVAHGVPLPSWRDASTCPMECAGGRIYQACGQETNCASSASTTEAMCSEGCFCPSGMFLNNNTCVTIEQCHCLLRGKRYPPGSAVPKECNTCTCISGEWSCTKRECPGRCEVVGDPHYKTFDGKTYDFMGKCSYYLLKMSNYSVEAENVPCDGSLSQSLGYPMSVQHTMPACTKSVTITMGKTVIKLKQGKEVSINGEEHSLPASLSHAYIRHASSIYIQVILDDMVEVWWDGTTTVYIHVPPTLKGKTKGLCGTFTGSQKDDFLTPEGDVEHDAISFANKWKTKDICDNRVTDNLSPCDTNPQNKQTAEKLCAHLTSNLFAYCHSFVDPSKYFSHCLYDVCSCEGDPAASLCPILSAYSKECAYQGVIVDWRHKVRQCGLACPRGQEYKVCSNSCTLSCEDLASERECSGQCLEGCVCPTGMALDRRGQCIQISSCPCIYKGYQYPPGHKEIRRSSKGFQLCICENAVWSCQKATNEQVSKYPNNTAESKACSSKKNEVYTNCEPSEPVTCQNMHKQVQLGHSESVCYGGCTCKKGYVLDSVTKECVLPESCPCHHGGKSYNDNDKIQQDCNTCVCKQGKWTCTEEECSSICTGWGSSHFKTYDGKIYDFQGSCEYMFSKGALSESDKFNVIVEMVLCGSSGVSCSKSATLTVGSGDQQESVVFCDGKVTHSKPHLSRISLREAGLFLFADVNDLGLVVQWDKGTRIITKLDSKWKNRVAGLCGNFNDNTEDDFQTPSGGISEASSDYFCDSWKLHDYCPEVQPIKDTCEVHPERKSWAIEKCSILKSSVFKQCHSEVPVGPYLDRCVYDSCGCDEGGDCECLCTALAAYAHECNIQGIPIKWRTQQLCPIQCDQRCSEYSSCVPTCPVETCENVLNVRTDICQKDACIEGCLLKPCPEGMIYSNLSIPECVPKATCKPVCLVIDGKIFYEGDLMEKDDCHSCYCSRNKKSCSGEPCTELTTQITVKPTASHIVPDVIPGAGPSRCITGWSQWFNRYHPEMGNKLSTDNESLPLLNDFTDSTHLVNNQVIQLGSCNIEKMVNIECRTADSKYSVKEFGEDVICTLENDVGLLCVNGCHDYEIRVYCQCELKTTVLPEEDEEEERSGKLNLCKLDGPLKKDPDDCSKYYQCQDTASGARWISRDCAPSTLYNPESMNCEWPHIVKVIRPECVVSNETEVFTTFSPIITINVCLEGEEWDDCYINCNQLCHYYEKILFKNGVCSPGQTCSPGCKVNSRPNCPQFKKWRDAQTCVEEKDCICKSKSGKLVKPGETVREGACEVCQCLNNFYICDTKACETEVVPTTLPPTVTKKSRLEVLPEFVTTPHPVVIKLTLPGITPPPHCDVSDFIPLTESLPDSAFNASSSLGVYTPELSRFSSPGVWKAAKNNDKQYLLIDLGKVENVYGVTMKTVPREEEFVTRYLVLNSIDNINYDYITFMGIPEIFQGPLSSYEEKMEIFGTPVEARYIMISPSAWVSNIALKVELYGCGVHPTTQLPVTSSVPPICKDKMSTGMADSQIFVSSSETSGIAASDVTMDSLTGWVPALSAPNEYIQFDFRDTRTLTGIKTAGSGLEIILVDNYPSWVSSYKVGFSNDGKTWSYIVDQFGAPLEFFGNINSENVKMNIFEQPLRARYLKIVPTKWHKKIALRAEVLGCYEPYPVEPVTSKPRKAKDCNICPGAPVPDHCLCTPSEWWDGEQCTPRTQCPCFVQFISYPVGVSYENDNCEQCICGLNGVAKCNPIPCPPCIKGLISRKSESCGCLCKPCAASQKACPTSNVCIDASRWCDGVIDCPDDEVNCIKMTTTSAPPECPPVECPSGFYANLTKEQVEIVQEKAWSPFGSASKWNTYFNKPRAVKGTQGVKTRKGTYNFKKHAYAPPQKLQACPQYKCLPINEGITKLECPPKPTCLTGYDLQIGKGNETKCETYSCVKQEVKIPDGRCNITGRSFATFDGTEYKYDICDHILIKDQINNLWEVRQIMECSYIGPCKKYLVIKQLNDTLKLRTDLTVEFNKYNYSIPQLQKIGAQFQQFVVKQISDTYLLYSSIHGFSVIWDTLGNVKIIVPGSSRGSVEGMCGYFDGSPANDKMKPDGSLAKTSAEFGNSWGDSSRCEIRVCPVQVQKEAFKACNALREEPLSKCSSVVSLDKLITQCVETMCSCIESNQTHCHCGAILHAITQCHSFNPSLDFTGWRIQNDCPVDCPEGQVYKECFRRACEPCCSELMVQGACPIVQECFPGCYCPEGYVRDGERCVKPSDCRDCICEGYDLSRYVTFDKQDYRFGGNCTYVISQTIENIKGPNFKIYGTNGLCDDGSGEICLQSATILIRDHYAHVGYDKERKLKVIIDDKELETLSLRSEWVNVHETAGKSVLICLVKFEVDLEFFVKGKGFALRVPSHFFFNKTEGLCGNCNLNINDDFKTSEGIITNNFDAFGTSWRVKELPRILGKTEDICEVGTAPPKCVLPPALSDPCLKLYDIDTFGKCHAVVDASIYVENCHAALCKEELSICQFLESYVRECQAEGICIDWRSPDTCPYFCPKGLEYKYCTLGCTLTCENYKLYKENPSACKTPLRESCICHKGQVMKNDVCINSSRCEPCDEEGHYPGEEWHPDMCTKCSCTQGIGIQCQKTQCPPSPLCSKGFKKTLLKATQSDCCPQYVCVPEPTEGPVCPEPQQPTCGYGQVMQLETTAGGCQEFTCRCKAPDECEDVSEELSKERETGMVAKTDTSGCCPKVLVVCDVTTCPLPPTCPPFHKSLIKETKSCCPLYSCELPEGKCVYEMSYEENVNGGEKPRDKDSKTKILKDFGDSWNDGPCRNCECKEGSEKASCSKKVCGIQPKSESYIYEPKYVNHKCCPIYIRTACKMNGKIYKANETWSDPNGNSCKKFTCAAGASGEISTKEAVQTCKKDCPLGWEYFESINKDECCGICKQVGCVVNGTVHKKDSTWYSSDKCTEYSCEADNEQFQLITFPTVCPNITGCPVESLVDDGCCKKCNVPIITPGSHTLDCKPDWLPLSETVMLIRLNSEEHGICSNLDPIHGFTECNGTCRSHSQYNQDSGSYDTQCQCCEGTKFTNIPVRLDCADGYFFNKEVSVPSSCDCKYRKCTSIVSKPQYIKNDGHKLSY